MKVAVVGCGALGSFYGAKLARSGHQAHFLLRSDYAAVSANGVQVRSPDGDFRVRPHCARTPEEIGPSDLVLIGLKTTANDQFGRLLPPLVRPHTAVVTLQNGLGNEEQLARFFPGEQVLGGLCFVCLNRIEPGLIHHMVHGQIVLGEFQGPAGGRTAMIADQFRQAGVACGVTNDLARAHWEKLVWNIPFNGLGVAGVAGFEGVIKGELPQAALQARPGQGAGLVASMTTDRLLADARWAGLVRELMIEVISAARALGHAIPESIADEQIERTRAMDAYKPSTLIDYERGQPIELESLFLEPLRQAQAAGVPAPRLEALCRLLRKLDTAASRPNLSVRF